jgi:hypothetical protein
VFSGTFYEKNIQLEDTFYPLKREFPGKMTAEPTGAIKPGRQSTGPQTGSTSFRRDIMLPRLIPVCPAEIADASAGGRRQVLRRLAKALRGERARGRAGHWSYSLNRHIGLLQAFRAERAAFRALYPRRPCVERPASGDQEVRRS